MAVKVVDKKTGQSFSGKFAVLEKEKVSLWTGCMSDKKGGLRGCGRKHIFDADSVSVNADDPSRELKQVA
jgi:hypothetical protein